LNAKKQELFLKFKHTPPEVIQSFMLGMQRRAFDQLFIDTGIEGEDFVLAIKTLNLKEDAEFKAVGESYKKQFDEWITEQKAASEAAAKARMEGAVAEDSKSAATQ